MKWKWCQGVESSCKQPSSQTHAWFQHKPSHQTTWFRNGDHSNGGCKEVFIRHALYIINFNNAYDSVNCDSLNTSTLMQSTATIKLSVIPALHEDSMAFVRAHGKTSEEFTVTSGIRQGCMLTLFNHLFDVAICMALENHIRWKVEVWEWPTFTMPSWYMGNWRNPQPETIVTDLEYTDDMALIIGWSQGHVGHSGSMLWRPGSLHQLYMRRPLLPSDLSPRPKPIQLFPNDVAVKVMSHFQYLGSIAQDDWVQPLRSAQKSVGPWKQSNPWAISSVTSKRSNPLPSCASSMLSFYSRYLGLESMVCPESQINWLQSFVMWYLRIILRASNQGHEMQHHHTEDGQTAEVILSAYATQTLGHLSQIDNCLPKHLLVCAPVGGSCAVGGHAEAPLE